MGGNKQFEGTEHSPSKWVIPGLILSWFQDQAQCCDFTDKIYSSEPKFRKASPCINPQSKTSRIPRALAPHPDTSARTLLNLETPAGFLSGYQAPGNFRGLKKTLNFFSFIKKQTLFSVWREHQSRQTTSQQQTSQSDSVIIPRMIFHELDPSMLNSE